MTHDELRKEAHRLLDLIIQARDAGDTDLRDHYRILLFRLLNAERMLDPQDRKPQ